MKSKMMVLFVISVLLLMVLSIPLETKHALAASTEGIVKATTLNVREAASTSSKKIGSIKKGQRVTIIKQQSGWLQIKYGSKNGWVSKQYISTVDILLLQQWQHNNVLCYGKFIKHSPIGNHFF